MGGNLERLPSDSSADAFASKRARLVRQIAGVLSSAAPIAQVLDRCVELLAELAGAPRVAIVWQGSSVEPVFSAHAVALPVRFAESELGRICVDAPDGVDDELRALLESCALHVGARLYHERVVESSERYAHLALTDALTGIANRRKFDECLASEWTRARRDGAPLSLLMIDLDYFKNFNDTYGHQAGDACLQEVARALQACASRTTDLAARYGGEEFVALLPGTDAGGAIALAERLRAAIASNGIAHEGSSLRRLSVSVGAATRVPSDDSSASDLLQRADEALYRAKLSGRNRVIGEGYESAAPPARRSLPADRTNVPLPLTPLVGRSGELAELCTLLKQHRLLSIVGTGGSGKTRIAIAAAAQVHESFEDGTWFVDLAPVRDKNLVASRIASALRAEVVPGPDAAETLAAAIGERELLLVVDNAEHVLSGVAAVLGVLLGKCRGLRVLVTTREPLAHSGEAIYRLPLLAPADAFDLFVDRLRAARRDFAVNDESAAIVRDLCRRLDGLALAIELVASRAALVGVEHVAGDVAAAAGRAPTMKAAIDWSYDALSEAERALFRRLAVFAGGFGFDDALQVCEAQAQTLEALVRKSLVVDDLLHAGRYRLLELMREYAAEQLAQAGELHAYARAHARHYASVAAVADGSFSGVRGAAWFAQFSPDLDNFRAALRWALVERNECALGASIVAHTGHLFDNLHPAENTRWIQFALREAKDEMDDRTHARLCLNLVSGSRHLPAPELRVAAERAVEIYRAAGDPFRLSDALRTLAQLIGWYFRDEREYADALACESIEIARTIGNPLHLASCLRTRGLTIDIADLPAKRAVLEETLMLIRRHGNERQLGSMLTWVSEFEFSAGNDRRAYEYGREAVRVAETSGARSLEANAHSNLSRYAAALGEWDLARKSASACVRISREISQPEHFTFGMQTFAEIAAHEERLALAAQLLGFCDARCGVLHPHRQADQSEDRSYRRLMQRLEEELPDLHAELRNGARLSEEEVLVLVAPAG